jgi:HEAT repeat protein
VTAALDLPGDVPWGEMNHAYGPASDIPKTLRDLGGPDAKRAKAALRHCTSAVYHQGQVYAVTPYLVPYVWQMVDDPGALKADRLLGLLWTFAGGEEYTYAEIVRSLDEENPEYARWMLDTRQAIVAGLLPRLGLLDHPEPAVRQAMLYLVATLAEAADRLVPELLERFTAATDVKTRLGLLLALGELGGGQPEPVVGGGEHRLTEFGGGEHRLADLGAPTALDALLDDNDPAVRVAAALALHQSGRRDRSIRGILLGAVGPTPKALGRLRWSGDTDGAELVRHAVAGDAEIIAIGLDDPSETVRRTVIGLAQSAMFRRDGRERFVPLLAPALTGRPGPTRSAAIWTVARYGASAREPFLDAFAEALAAPGATDEDVAWCLHTLARYGDARCLDPLIDAVANRRTDLYWPTMIAGLGSHVRAADVVTCAHALVATGMRNHLDRLLPAIDAYLTDLWRRDQPPTVYDLGWPLHRTHMLDAVTACGPAAVNLAPTVLTLLDDPGESQAHAAADTIAAILPAGHPLVPEAAAAVRRILDSDNAPVRPYLARAYWRLTGDPGPVLANLDDRASTLVLQVVGELGPAAADAVDWLRPQLTRERNFQQRDVGYAWWRVTGDLDTALPMILTLRGHDITTQWLGWLVEIGRPAAPIAGELRPWLERDLDWDTYGYPEQSDDKNEQIRRTLAAIEG